MEREEILLREYGEAGLQCRWYERMIRLNLSIFLPLETLLTGFVWQYAPSRTARIVGAIIGCVIGILAILSDIRLRQYYQAFRDRAIEIEGHDTIKMRLYSDTKKRMDASSSIRHRFVYRGVFVVFMLILLGGIFLSRIGNK